LRQYGNKFSLAESRSCIVAVTSIVLRLQFPGSLNGQAITRQGPRWDMTQRAKNLG
jgi:hypothetical protein